MGRKSIQYIGVAKEREATYFVAVDDRYTAFTVYIAPCDGTFAGLGGGGVAGLC